MAGDKNVRIRGDLVPTLEARARRLGATLNGYVSDVIRAHLFPAEWGGGERPGLTTFAQPLIDAVDTDQVWIVLYGGLPPRLTMVAGKIIGAGPTHIRVHVHGTERRVIVARVELTAWWMPRHQDHPVPEIRDAIVESQASVVELMHLMARPPI